ncbi:MAG: hypothetical protein FJ297_12505 [Planctomycetes bacterium]|nr:hypothetical protein [Planctomycetota bacterium]
MNAHRFSTIEHRESPVTAAPPRESAGAGWYGMDGPLIASGGPSTGRSLVWFATALSVVFPFYAAWGWAMYGRIGLVTAVVALAVCGLGGTAALLSGVWLQRRSPVGGAVGGMLFRFGIPFVAAIGLTENFPVLARAGQFAMVVGYYLFALVIETILAVRLIAPPRQPAVSSRVRTET